MKNLRPGHEHHLDGMSACAKKEINIIKIDEIALIHETDPIEDFPLDQHAASRRIFDPHLFVELADIFLSLPKVDHRVPAKPIELSARTPNHCRPIIEHHLRY